MVYSYNAIADPEEQLVDDLPDLPLQGFPKDEAKRRKVWSRVPRKARIGCKKTSQHVGT